MIFTIDELAWEHSPLFTTARNQVSSVNTPIAAVVNVVAVLTISVELETKLSFDLCHLTTEPV